MWEGMKNVAVVWTAGIFLFVFFLWCLLKPADAVSESERRPLAAKPQLAGEAVWSGKFMEDFEDYAMDQFPLRDAFRTLKAASSFYVFRQKDAGGIYMADGYVSKLEYPLHKDSIDNAAAKFQRIYEKYLSGRNVKVYLSVIPDKNFFLAKEHGYPAMDYGELVSYLREKTDYMQYIDIFDCLELSDYYSTDTHWRQEKIVDVAERLAEGMGGGLSEEYTVELLDRPFYGVYYGQSALPLPAERIYYLHNGMLDSCQVYDYETGRRISVYDMEKAQGKDPYEMFLSGSKSLISVRNDNASTGKRLVIFRDSFGSSIAPLLFEEYEEVTLIDIRYLSSEMLGNFVDFEDCDVLFLYSTLVLNNSITLK